MYKLSEVWQFTKIKLTDYSNRKNKLKYKLRWQVAMKEKEPAVLIKCLKGKTLPDNHVKLTYETVTLFPLSCLVMKHFQT